MVIVAVRLVNVLAPVTFNAVKELSVLAPVTFNVPPTYTLPPIPTPLVTFNAPVVVDVEFVVFVMLTALVVLAPLPVTLCNVLVSQIVIAPDAVLIAVSVPAIRLTVPVVPLRDVTPNDPMLADVRT